MNTDASPLPSPLITKAQAAAYLGIAPRTLDDWRAAQAIPCIERPGYVRFLQSDLEEFIHRHRIDARRASAYRPRGAGKGNSDA